MEQPITLGPGNISWIRKRIDRRTRLVRARLLAEGERGQEAARAPTEALAEAKCIIYRRRQEKKRKKQQLEAAARELKSLLEKRRQRELERELQGYGEELSILDHDGMIEYLAPFFKGISFSEVVNSFALSDRERLTLLARYDEDGGVAKTYREIGKTQKTSAERIRQILIKGHRDLKVALYRFIQWDYGSPLEPGKWAGLVELLKDRFWRSIS